MRPAGTRTDSSSSAMILTRTLFYGGLAVRRWHRADGDRATCIRDGERDLNFEQPKGGRSCRRPRREEAEKAAFLDTLESLESSLTQNPQNLPSCEQRASLEANIEPGRAASVPADPLRPFQPDFAGFPGLTF